MARMRKVEKLDADQVELIDNTEETEKPKGKRGGFPTQVLNQIEPDKKQMVVARLRELTTDGKPKDNKELKDRIDKYFMYCQEQRIAPSIMTLCYVLHTNRQSLNDWAKGKSCDKEKQEIIYQAKMFIYAYLEQVSMNGSVNPATSIFLMKNWLGYADSIQIQTEQSDTSRLVESGEVKSDFMEYLKSKE